MFKLPFPYKFMDSYDKMNYIGNKPGYEYYNIKYNDYNNISDNWNAKIETIKYLEQDCLI